MDENLIKKAKGKALKNREAILKKSYELVAAGVMVHEPERLYIRGELTCGKNVEIDINVIIEGSVVLEDDVSIGANCILRKCSIGSGTRINPFSIVEESKVANDCIVGPYSRLRPETSIGDYVQIGNFVEIKNSTIDSNCKINHMSFIGDTKLAERVTIGAGSITCNHDTVKFNKTVIEEGAYVGSGCNLVAPIKVGKNSVIGSGSTITENVPEDILVIARARQMVVKNWKGPRNHKDDRNVKT